MGHERFGRYTVHECLGAGGMAVVHRATVDIGGGVIREVALKRLLPQLADDKQLVEDFIREARIAAQLHHPNIVRILELGRTAGTYFIAMELVSGHSLLQLMRFAILVRSPAPIGIVIALLVELCDALDYASHATDTEGEPLHVVHRDLSPSNLIVDADGHLKIIDFGVAKALSGKFMTSSGTVKGKFGYMSLEALSGKPLDRRTDIFSVGVVAWELVTGRRLFRAANEYDVVKQIQRGASEPPSAHNAACPDALDEIIMRALARSRDDRWSDAAVMRRALDSLCRTYRESASDIAAWVKQLVASADRDAELTYEASGGDGDPPSIAISQIETLLPPDPFDDDEPLSDDLAAFGDEPDDREALQVLQGHGATAQLPDDMDFSITPFALEMPTLEELEPVSAATNGVDDPGPGARDQPVNRTALAEGSKRRAAFSRPPSTLAKRFQEQRRRSVLPAEPSVQAPVPEASANLPDGELDQTIPGLLVDD